MKNLNSTLTNGPLIVLAVLTFIFMSQAYYTTTVGVANGFDLMDAGDMPAKYQLLAASNIIACVLVSLIIVVAVVSLLVDYGVIKNKKLAKIINIVNVVLASLLLIFSICAISAMASIVSDFNAMSANFCSIGWALIVNLIVAVLMCAVAGYVMLTSRKK